MNISVVAIGLSLTIMILAVSMLFGFKKEIKRKLSGFSAHVQVTRLDSNNSFESPALSADTSLAGRITSLPEVNTLFPFATKPALLKSGADIQGVILYGVQSDFRWDFFDEYLERGQIPDFSTPESLDLLISSSLANLLRLDTGDRIPAYFIQDPPRMRPFRIAGIYNTGLEEYDLRYCYCHLSQIQGINGWQTDQVGGYGIMLEDPERMDEVADQLRETVGTANLDREEMLQVSTLRQWAPGFFDFLRLTDMNVWVILILMVLVSGFNMISGLMILILDRTRMIGTLKALGARNRSIRRIFLMHASVIIGKGLLLGNFLGIGLAYLQYRFQLIPLDPTSYFIDTVPIHLSLVHLILLNAGAFLLTLLMLLIPSGIISRLSPEKTIKFD